MAPHRSNLHVRSALPEEAPAIAAILAAAFAEYASAYTPQALAATTPMPDQISRRFNEGPVWVALLDGAIVGTVSAVPRGDRLYVRSMGVLPTARGRGVGGLLLGQVESFAAQQGHNTLFLSTTPFLEGAIELYERYGFRRSSEGPYDLFGTPLFTMVKELGPSK